MVEVRGHDTLSTTLLRWASQLGERVFVEFADTEGNTRSVTFAGLAARANQVAGMLRSHGIGVGDRFHVQLPNSIEFLECLFAGAYLGAVMVPTNPESTSDDLAYVLSHSAAKLSVTRNDRLDTVRCARDMAEDLDHILVVGSDAPAEEATSYESSLATASHEPITSEVDPRTPALIMYTSGTTGWPKGVEVTHSALLHAGDAVAESLRIRPDDRWLVTLPLFHGNALYYSTMSALVSGASLALLEHFDSATWSERATQHGATLASLFATQLRMILTEAPAHPGDARAPLRATAFAQHVAGSQLAEFEHRFRCPLVQLYGMTETVAPPLMNPLYGERRNTTLGLPIAGTPVRIVDQTGRDVAAGEVGELLIGGEPGVTVMNGYHRNPDATRDAFRDGWLHTGDRVRSDADGYLHFHGRISEVLKPLLDNVSAAEIERVVLDNWAVYDCAAIGIPDPVRDQAIKLYVVPQPSEPLTPDEVGDWCDSHLAEHKRPDTIEIVDDLPRTPVGKIDRYALQSQPSTRPPVGNSGLFPTEA